jgi:toxin ParE1/3/4
LSRILRRNAARRDLVDIYRYYDREAGRSVADRFLAQAEATFTRLAERPGLGAPYDHQHPALADARYSPLPRFKKYLVFYRPLADGIEVFRVLHGARDIDSILSEEFDLPGEDELDH